MLLCRPEFEVACLAYTILAPELVSFWGILRIRVHNYLFASGASKKEHSLHFVELKLALVFLPERVAVFAD
jgi:hypothetical protein